MKTKKKASVTNAKEIEKQKIKGKAKAAAVAKKLKRQKAIVKKKEKPSNIETQTDEFYPKEKRHFRYRVKDKKGINHPNYIIGETDNDYLTLGITHSKYKDKKKTNRNHLLESNPNKNDPEPAYIRKQIEKTRKHAFEPNKLKGHKLSPKDDEYVDTLVDKRRRYKEQQKK